MALRLVLVGLVASMGIELPSGSDLANWTRTGREWAGVRMADLSVIRVEAARTCAGPADCGPADGHLGAADVTGAGSGRADLAFDVVVEGMAVDFAADFASLRVDGPAPDQVPDAISGGERGVVPTELSWSDPEPVPADPIAEVAIEAPALPVEALALPVEATLVSRRSERLSTAVRLTRQALDAWARLIEGSAEAVADVR